MELIIEVNFGLAQVAQNRQISAPDERYEVNDSHHNGRTREIVAPRAVNWKVFSQQLGNLLDTVQGTGPVIALSEMGLHGLANRLPFAAIHLGVYASVHNDFDVAVRKKQIDKNAVVVLRVPNPEVRENLDGTVPRRCALQQIADVQRPLYSKPDLTHMRAMTGTYRLFNSDKCPP